MKIKSLMSLIVLSLAVIYVLGILLLLPTQQNSEKLKSYYRIGVEGYFLREDDLKRVLVRLSEDVLLDYWKYHAGNDYMPSVGSLNYTGVNPINYNVEDYCEVDSDQSCKECGTISDYTYCYRCSIEYNYCWQDNSLKEGDHCENPGIPYYSCVCKPANPHEIPGCDNFPIIKNLTKLRTNLLILTENILSCSNIVYNYCYNLGLPWTSTIHCECEGGLKQLQTLSQYRQHICQQMANEICSQLKDDLNNKLNTFPYPRKLNGTAKVSFDDNIKLNNLLVDYVYKTSSRFGEITSWRFNPQYLNVTYNVSLTSVYDANNDVLKLFLDNINVTYKLNLYHDLGLNISMKEMSYLFNMSIINKERESQIKIIPKYNYPYSIEVNIRVTN